MPDTRRSDHAPFWDQGVGAVMVTDTADLRSPHYHQPSDKPETLDPVFLAGVTEVVLGALETLLVVEPGPTTPPRRQAPGPLKGAPGTPGSSP